MPFFIMITKVFSNHGGCIKLLGQTMHVGYADWSNWTKSTGVLCCMKLFEVMRELICLSAGQPVKSIIIDNLM